MTIDNFHAVMLEFRILEYAAFIQQIS